MTSFTAENGDNPSLSLHHEETNTTSSDTSFPEDAAVEPGAHSKPRVYKPLREPMHYRDRLAYQLLQQMKRGPAEQIAWYAGKVAQGRYCTKIQHWYKEGNDVCPHEKQKELMLLTLKELTEQTQKSSRPGFVFLQEMHTVYNDPELSEQAQAYEYKLVEKIFYAVARQVTDKVGKPVSIIYRPKIEKHSL